ncbi:MAG: hypothetical protein AB1750_00795 [Chloroflexota bacterium]
MNANRFLISIVILSFVLAACSGAPEPTATAVPSVPPPATNTAPPPTDTPPPTSTSDRQVGSPKK